jgi:hypothetical protein
VSIYSAFEVFQFVLVGKPSACIGFVRIFFIERDKI